eukprot:634376-Prorocentrum_minimum.AAC.2
MAPLRPPSDPRRIVPIGLIGRPRFDHPRTLTAPLRPPLDPRRIVPTGFGAPPALQHAKVVAEKFWKLSRRPSLTETECEVCSERSLLEVQPNGRCGAEEVNKGLVEV